MNLIRLLIGAIAGSLGSVAAFDPRRMFSGRVWRGATPSRNKGINKDGLPSGYPGAKLARKAAQGKLTLRHG